MQQGYIRLYRCILDNGWSRDPDYMAVWVYCLLRGNYKASAVEIKHGSIVHLKPGEFITSRDQMSLNTGVEKNKVERILKVFKSEQQIEQRNHGKFRVISILNWDKYQSREQQNEQRMNNARTTDEQRMNTDKEGKEGKEGKEVKKYNNTREAEAGNEKTKNEIAFEETFKQKEGVLRQTFPYANFEAEKLTCMVYYQERQITVDPFVVICQWFNRIPKTGREPPDALPEDSEFLKEHRRLYGP